MEDEKLESGIRRIAVRSGGTSLIPLIPDKCPSAIPRHNRSSFPTTLRAGNILPRIAHCARFDRRSFFQLAERTRENVPRKWKAKRFWRRQEIYSSPFCRLRTYRVLPKASPPPPTPPSPASPASPSRQRCLFEYICLRFSSMKI